MLAARGCPGCGTDAATSGVADRGGQESGARPERPRRLRASVLPMQSDIDAYDFALLLARVMIAVMVFADGWRHVKAIRSGPGMANWFESLGLKPGCAPRATRDSH